LALRPLGFLLSTAIFLACGFYVLGERSYWLIMSIAIGVAGVFWWLMSEMLGVYLPALPEWAIFEQVAT
jgi:putative tricarboxylic transport membrane protein